MMRFSSKKRPSRPAGFTLIEMVTSVAIIGIVSGLALVQSQNTDDTARLDRAADEVVAALRYARIEAMGNCSTAAGSSQPLYAFGVSFDTSANTVTVYETTWNGSTWGLPGTTVGCAMYPTQTYLINFGSQPEVQGVTISSVSLGGTADTQANTASPYVCQYLPFGECENSATATGTIVLSFNGKTRTISIPQIGDASKN